DQPRGEVERLCKHYGKTCAPRIGIESSAHLCANCCRGETMEKLWKSLSQSKRELMKHAAVIAVVLSMTVSAGFAQETTRAIPLDVPGDLQSRNVQAEVVTYKGKKALRVTDTAPQNVKDGERYVILSKTEFQDGTIEVELTGEPAAAAGEG